MTQVFDTLQFIRATHAPRCCSDCARLAELFRRPCTRPDALALALEKKLGTREELEKRFDDMRASGLLVPYCFDE
jgi:hypothetical protein